MILIWALRSSGLRDELAHHAAADDHDIVHARLLALASQAKKLGSIGGIADGKEMIPRLQPVFTLGNDRRVVAIQRHNLEGRLLVAPAQFGQWHADEGRVRLQNQADHLDAPILQVDDMGGAGFLHEADDRIGRLALGVNDVVGAQFFRGEHKIRVGKLLVAHTGNRDLHAHFFGQAAGHQIGVVVVGHGSHHGSLLDPGLFQDPKAVAGALHDLGVQLLLGARDFRRVCFDDGDVVTFPREAPGELKTDVARADNQIFASASPLANSQFAGHAQPLCGVLRPKPWGNRRFQQRRTADPAADRQTTRPYQARNRRPRSILVDAICIQWHRLVFAIGA